MNKTIKLTTGSLSVHIDDREESSQAYVSEMGPTGNTLYTTTFTTRSGYREADSPSQFGSMSDEVIDTLNNLGRGSFVLP